MALFGSDRSPVNANLRSCVRACVRSVQVCLEQSIFIILAQIFKQSVGNKSAVSEHSEQLKKSQYSRSPKYCVLYWREQRATRIVQRMVGFEHLNTKKIKMMQSEPAWDILVKLVVVDTQDRDRERLRGVLTHYLNNSKTNFGRYTIYSIQDRSRIYKVLDLD